jgi:hypothetical protein
MNHWHDYRRPLGVRVTGTPAAAVRKESESLHRTESLGPGAAAVAHRRLPSQTQRAGSSWVLRLRGPVAAASTLRQVLTRAGSALRVTSFQMFMVSQK